MGLVVATIVVAAYAGISWRYADGVTKVTRLPLLDPAYVAAAHDDVSFRTADGLTLRGWWFAAPAPRDRAVVIVHGKDRNRIDSSFDPGRIARVLLAKGYSALLFDLRGHGESEGLRWGLGQYEPLDISAAVSLAAERARVPRSRVALVGESMGGGSVLMTVARDPDVGPVVVDSAYADARVIVDEVGPAYSGLPSAFTPGLVVAARVLYAIDIGTVVPTEVVRAHPERAFLFIQCLDDQTVRAHHGRDLRAASANRRSELWEVGGCGHVGAFRAYPSEWEGRVLAFLERELATGR